jgi:hypothetical protein
LSSLTLSTGSAVVGFFSVAAIDEYASFAWPKSAQPPCCIARTDGWQILQLAADKSKSKLSNSSSDFFVIGAIAPCSFSGTTAVERALWAIFTQTF